MATFLELVNAAARESGTLPGTLSSVSAATGREGKMVGWVREAWIQIQRSRNDWTFRYKPFSGTLIAGQMDYSPSTNFSITDFGGWASKTEDFEPFTLFDPAIGRADEKALRVVDYRTMVNLYDRGNPDQQRPQIVATAPDRSLVFGPPPDQAYTVRGWYKREVQTLSLDTDEPYISDEHHDAIKWRALLFMAEHDEAELQIATVSGNFRECLTQMLAEYTPRVCIE